MADPVGSICLAFDVTPLELGLGDHRVDVTSRVLLRRQRRREETIRRQAPGDFQAEVDRITDRWLSRSDPR